MIYILYHIYCKKGDYVARSCIKLQSDVSAFVESMAVSAKVGCKNSHDAALLNDF